MMNGARVSDSYVSLDWSSPDDVVERGRREGAWLLLLASYVDLLKYQGVDPEEASLIFAGLLLLPIHREGEQLRKFLRVGIFRIYEDAVVFQDTPEGTIIIV